MYIYRQLCGPDEITVQKFITTENDVKVFFPLCFKEVDVIIQSVKEPASDGNIYVSLLDVLMILTILVRGSLYDKAKYFYEWFHINSYELMSELELTLFIMRFAKFLNKGSVSCFCLTEYLTYSIHPSLKANSA